MQPATAKVFSALDGRHVPRIHFGVGTAELLPLMAESGADVVGVDWRTPLDRARDRLGPTSPCRATSTRRCAWPPGRSWPSTPGPCWPPPAPNPGHIFNLGHGVLPETDPDVLARLVDLVHQEGRAR